MEAISGEAGTLAGKHLAADRDGNAALNLDGGTVVDFKNMGSFPEFNAGFTLIGVGEIGRGRAGVFADG